MSAVLASIALACSTRCGPPQERTLLRGVQVVDLEQGRLLRDQSVLIEGQRIAQVAPSATLAAPDGTPTLVAFSTIQKITDDDCFELVKRAELCYVPPTVRAGWTPERERFRTGGWKPHLDFMARYLQRNVELQMAMARAFHEAGVPLMTGTDAPFDFVVPGFSLHDELALFVAAGLTPLEALRSATRVPAGFLGIGSESGSIAAGQRADLLLVEGNPLADIAATRRVVGVFLRGRWLAGGFLREQLDGLARRNQALERRVVAIAAGLDQGKLEEAVASFEEERDPRLASWLEAQINEKGYECLRARRIDEALVLLRRNAALFPASANAWDSLGEACMEKGDYEEALAHYERALELNPDSENSRRMIDRIVEKMADSPPPAEGPR